MVAIGSERVSQSLDRLDRGSNGVAMLYYMTEIWTADWHRSVAWYTSVLGLRLVLNDLPNQFALLAAEERSGRVAIKGGPTERAADRGAVRLVFEVADLDQLALAWSERGIAIAGPLPSAEGYRSLKIFDPDGTPIEVFEWVRSPGDGDRT